MRSSDVEKENQKILAFPAVKIWASCAVLLDVSNVCQFCENETLLNHICPIDSHITPKSHTVSLIISRKKTVIIIRNVHAHINGTYFAIDQ